MAAVLLAASNIVAGGPAVAEATGDGAGAVRPAAHGALPANWRDDRPPPWAWRRYGSDQGWGDRRGGWRYGWHRVPGWSTERWRYDDRRWSYDRESARRRGWYDERRPRWTRDWRDREPPRGRAYGWY